MNALLSRQRQDRDRAAVAGWVAGGQSGLRRELLPKAGTRSLAPMRLAQELVPLPPSRFPGELRSAFSPPQRDVWASALWYETTLAHALPAGSEALALRAGRCTVLLLRHGGRVSALATPYTQAWRPLGPEDVTQAEWTAAGLALAGLLRFRPPARLEAIESDAAWLAPLLSGLEAGGMVARCFAHTLRRIAPLDLAAGWSGYLAERPSPLRNTISRRLKAAARTARLELIRHSGPELERGLSAFRAVRARSWKPEEPFPEFDPALIRAAAEAGVVRLGVLREADDTPIAAQYWLVESETGRALVPKLFHDEAKRASSPGTVLTALMVRHLIEEDRVRMLDFGRGDDAYKALWAPDRVPLVGVLLADPRHPLGAAALACHALGRLLRRLRDGS